MHEILNAENLMGILPVTLIDTELPLEPGNCESILLAYSILS